MNTTSAKLINKKIIRSCPEFLFTLAETVTGYLPFWDLPKVSFSHRLMLDLWEGIAKPLHLAGSLHSKQIKRGLVNILSTVPHPTRVHLTFYAPKVELKATGLVK